MAAHALMAAWLAEVVGMVSVLAAFFPFLFFQKKRMPTRRSKAATAPLTAEAMMMTFVSPPPDGTPGEVGDRGRTCQRDKVTEHHEVVA